MTPADLWNVAKIDAGTDKAIADHAKEPHELPRVGTMVCLHGDIFRIVFRQSLGWFEGLSVDGRKLSSRTSLGWHYATPEQRRVAWGGEG